jgi:hypothetical protein
MGTREPGTIAGRSRVAIPVILACALVVVACAGPTRPTVAPGPPGAGPASAIASTAPAMPGPALIISVANESSATVDAAVFPTYCPASSEYMARADELLDNRYLLPPHPIVTLPTDPTWAENPLHETNWVRQYQSLRFTLALLRAWQVTGESGYLDRFLFLLRDWYRDNPRSKPASDSSWEDMPTGLRAIVYACAADLVPMQPWLHDALVLHGRILADPSFYARPYNHALNQDIGLLEVGRVLGRLDWVTLARDRINALAAATIDSQGVTNEQSIGYQAYNYARYQFAADRLRAAGMEPGTAFGRVDLMPRMLALATIPTGTYEMLGDTEAERPSSVDGSWLEYVRSAGSSGPRPPLVKTFAAGYLFARSGWGTSRPFEDETLLTARWGPARKLHGHDDGTSITLAAWGSRLIVDPGKYTYNKGAWRNYFVSHKAHNVVTVDGVSWRKRATTLVAKTVTSRLVDVRLRTDGYRGVVDQRRITWSRGLDYVLVEDQLTSTSRHTYRQLWHLVDGSNPTVGTSSVRTRRHGANVLIRELVGSPKLRVRKGATKPIQGWISYQYGHKVAAPVVEAVKSGTKVRFLTLIVPAQGRPQATVSGLRLTRNGYSVTITIDGRSERVVAGRSSVSITPVTD